MKPLNNFINRVAATAGKTESPIEALMLVAFTRSRHFILASPKDEIAGEGKFVIPQYEFGPYRADFMIVAHGFRKKVRAWPLDAKTMVAIECDGKDFHTTDEQIENDKKRDAYFKENGIPTLRFTGSEIYNHGDLLVRNINDYVNDRLQGLYEV